MDFLSAYRYVFKTDISSYHYLLLCKDSFNIRGTRSTIGYVDFLKHQPSTNHSAVVGVLIAQGAVLYVKTNVPQTLIVCRIRHYQKS